MFDQILRHPHALKRHRNSPLIEERRAFLTHLAKQGLSHENLCSTANYLLTIIEYLQLDRRDGENISVEEIERYAKAWANRKLRPKRMKSSRKSQRSFRSVATRWLEFLERLETPPQKAGPYEAMITSYSDYMLRERGLASATIRGRCWFLRRFLGQLSDVSLEQITIKQIDELLQQFVQTGSYSRVTIRLWATNLRAFFRYAEMNGWCLIMPYWDRGCADDSLPCSTLVCRCDERFLYWSIGNGCVFKIR